MKTEYINDIKYIKFTLDGVNYNVIDTFGDRVAKVTALHNKVKKRRKPCRVMYSGLTNVHRGYDLIKTQAEYYARQIQARQHIVTNDVTLTFFESGNFAQKFELEVLTLIVNDHIPSNLKGYTRLKMYRDAALNGGFKFSYVPLTDYDPKLIKQDINRGNGNV